MARIEPTASAGLMDFVNPPNGWEVIRYSFYSRKAALAAATVSGITVSFFSDVVGVNSATLRDTNMTKPNAIANPNRFYAQWFNFRLYSNLIADTAANNLTLLGDVMTVLQRGVIQIRLLAKEYLTIPALDVPAGSGVYSAISGATGTVGAAGATNGMPNKQNSLRIDLPLEKEATFNVDLSFPDASIPALVNATLRPEAVLHGLLLRPKQ